jgi:integrase
VAQGSIEKIETAGRPVRYRARAEAVDPGTGRRQQPMKSFATRAEAQSWLREMQQRAERGEWGFSAGRTLKEWVNEWLEGPGARGRKPNTVLTYRQLLVKRAVPKLGGTPLRKLTPAALERFFREEEATYAPASVHTLYAALHVCLADAVRLGALGVNPLAKVQAPTAPARERPAWGAEQARAFLGTAAQGEDYALWLTVLSCALRIGEALALTWADVDSERGLLHVRRTLTRSAAGREIVGTTTKSGKERTIPLTQPGVEALRLQHIRVLTMKAAHRDVWSETDLCFPTILGLPMSTTWARLGLKALCTAARVPPLTPHGLRHTAASILAEHASVGTARDILGHASLAVTNLYIHSSDGAKQAGIEALGHLLTGS